MLEIHTLVPELLVSDFERSLDFYTRSIGFEVAQRHGGELHAYLELQGAQIMIAQRDGTWETAPMEVPFGRGLNLQIMIDDVPGLYRRVTRYSIEPYLTLETKWYRRGSGKEARIFFGLLDPDGYFLRFVQVLRHDSGAEAGGQ